MKRYLLLLIVSLLVGAGKVVGQDCTVTGPSASTSVCLGGITTLSVSASGTNTYQWQYSANGTSGWANVIDGTPVGITYSGGTGNSLIITGSGSESTGNLYYQCIVTGTSPVCGPTTSSAAAVTIVSDPSLSAPAALSTICLGGNVTLSTTLSDGTGTFGYQWEYSTNGSSGWAGVVNATPTGITYSGGTTNSLTVTGDGTEAVSSKYYRCVVTATGSGCGTATSANAVVSTVSTLPLTGPVALTEICKGGSATLSTSVDGGSGSYTYQWQYSSDGSTFADVADATPAGITYTGETASSLTIAGDGSEIADDLYFQCIVSSSGCSSTTSSAATVTIVSDPSLSAPAVLTTLCKGGNVTLSTTLSGGTGTFGYQWEYSTDGSSGWASVVNATPTGITYSGGTTNSLTVTGDGTEDVISKYYRCIVTATGSGCGTATSDNAQVTTVSDPSLSAPAALTTICLGGNVTLSTTLSDGTGTFGYQWEYSTDGSSGWAGVVNATPSGITYSGGTTNSLTVTGDGTEAISSKYYRCVVTATGSGCGTATSANAEITSVANLSLSGPPALSKVCLGSNKVLSLTASGGTGTYSYQWKYSADGSSGWSNVSNGTPSGITYSGGTTNSLTVTGNGTEAINSKFYQCIVSDVASGCPAVSSTVAELVTQPDNASSVTYEGSFTEGGELTVHYIFSSLACFPNDRSLTRYTWNKDGNSSHGTYTSNIAQFIGDSTYVLPDGIEGNYIMVKIEIWNGSSYQTAVESSWSTGTVAANSKPEASAISITGDALVGKTLTGSYTYTDAENDPQGTSLYQWVRADNSDGTLNVTNIGTSSLSYTLVAADGGKYIGLKVTPKATTGTLTGDQVTMATPWFGPIISNAPVASNLQVIGDPKSGTTVYGYYLYSDVENDPESGSEYQWYVATASDGTGMSPISGATSITYKIADAYIGSNYIGFSVKPRASSGVTPGTTVYSAVFKGPVTNAVPVASGVSITGSTPLNVNDILSGNYTYSDPEGDLEGTSTYEWLRDVDNDITGATSTGITTRTYQVTLADTGKYLFFRVIPKAATGNLTGGIPEASTASSRANTPPYAIKMPITFATFIVGSVLTGNYEYRDHDLNPQGTSTFRWLRDGITPIPGATNINYTIDLDDEGHTLVFEVTPVSSVGYPNIGNAVLSDPTTVVPGNSKPVASQVCIQGIRKENEILTGKYFYDFEKPEGVSAYQWYRDGSAIGSATALTYTMTALDLDKDITFKVTPKSVDPVKEGDTQESKTLARITISQVQYAQNADTVTLTAVPTSPGSGVFSGPGVSDGMFIPSTLKASAVPYPVKYVYYENNSVTTCVSEHVRDFTITASSTEFNSPKDTMCYNDDAMWITVNAVPPGAIPYTYYADYGTYGYDYGFYMNTPYWSGTNNTNIGIVDQDLTNSPYSSSGAAWRVKIDPKLLKPGYAGYTTYYLYLYYYIVIDGYNYYYQIRLPIVTEQVSQVSSISNLKAEYCHGDLSSSIQAYSLYPSGGSALWTGAILGNLTNLIATINPGTGDANGAVYPITYQYTSKAGCKSNLFSTTAVVNPMPDASFSIDPLYDLNGDATELVPDVAPGAGYETSFVGPGIIKVEVSPSIFKYNFLPGIAEEGSKTLAYKVKTDKNCYAESTETTYVEKATGTFNGIQSKECYSDKTYTITISDLPDDDYPCTPVNFWNAKGGLVWSSGTLSAQYNLAAARAGYDTLFFKYQKLSVDFTIKKPVFIDSIGKITITGLKDEYCDYEGLVTTRALVENSTGAGTFSFTGPPAALANFLGYAIFDPAKTTTGNQYYVKYTHTSAVNSSGCVKKDSVPVFVNLSPSVNIVNSRITVNIKEDPIILSGSPSDGIFSGRGVYKSGSDYVFDPLVAGLGDAEFSISYTDTEGCSASKKDTLTVESASGSILGLNLNNQYCYDGTKDTIRYSSSKTWYNGSFSGAGITDLGSAKAVLDPASAGKGDHDIIFTYYDQYNTKFEVSATVNVDSLGVVEIKPIASGEEYCENAEPVELITTPRGGIFTGPVTTGYFTPSKALGDTAITYTYLNVRTGCSITGRVPFTIHPAPVVSFVPSDLCIENDIDSIKFINNTISTDAVSDWLWSFSDIGGTGYSSKQLPAYLFKSGGQHLITLTATTVNNCIVKKDITFDLGIKPVADFIWKNECYVPGDSIMLIDNTVSTSVVKSRTWNFFDGKPLKSGTTVYYPKSAIGAIPVQYIVQTNYANCSDTVNKNIYVRPNIVLSADGYFENFESGNGGWSKGDESLNSWTFGKPDRNIIKSAASGISAWFTRFDSVQVESSSVISPCFDFKNMERPMISLGLWRSFDENRDGAALQYRIGDAGTWQYVGTMGDGINWFSSAQIKGKPGGEQLGWTSSGADLKWNEARHTLDDLKGKKDVKFRIAYGSDGDAKKGTEGLAFDDIFIGERKRSVLVEHFANTASLTSSQATAMIDTLDKDYDEDIVTVQYHTNFPGIDSFYVNNPGDASARILYYGLTKAPYTYVDGGINPPTYQRRYDYSERELDNTLTGIDPNDIIRRSLVNPLFDIKLDSLIVSGGVLTIGGDISSLKDTTLSNLTLYLAVVEKSNSNYQGAGGETKFLNVFRKFVPDAAGINLGKTWTKGSSVSIPEQTWIIQKTLNSSDIEVVAFLQNNLTKDVYQAASMLKPKISVGIEKPGVLDKIDFALYPNPAKHQLTISFGEQLKDDTDIFIYDFSGIVVRTYRTGAGETEFTVDDLGLKDGMYLIRVSSGGMSKGFKKLIISGS